MVNLLKSLRKTVLARALQPAWVDEARLLIQRAVFQQVLTGYAFTGLCLNAGCGEGLFSEFLESFPAVETIINLDLVCPTIPQQRRDPRHQAMAGSPTALPLESATVDTCLCSEVLEHIDNDVMAVAELARVIKPSGLLLISVPTPPAPPDPQHVREGYTLQDLTALLISHGFEVLRHRYCFYLWKRLLYHLWQWQFVTLGRRKRSVFPRFLLLAMGYADRLMPLGKPWDLVVLAQRSPS
ncbi:MAG: class I SAM-dependent methyltransferase [Cyanobacteriota bacterium SKYGB_h_bin112]|nr:class I SAM-dependent methyltransferase [Cyanobacteriota bacterium SKYGB_h_bin112]